MPSYEFATPTGRLLTSSYKSYPIQEGLAHKLALNFNKTSSGQHANTRNTVKTRVTSSSKQRKKDKKKQGKSFFQTADWFSSILQPAAVPQEDGRQDIRSRHLLFQAAEQYDNRFPDNPFVAKIHRSGQIDQDISDSPAAFPLSNSDFPETLLSLIFFVCHSLFLELFV